MRLKIEQLREFTLYKGTNTTQARRFLKILMTTVWNGSKGADLEKCSPWFTACQQSGSCERSGDWPPLRC